MRDAVVAGLNEIVEFAGLLVDEFGSRLLELVDLLNELGSPTNKVLDLFLRRGHGLFESLLDIEQRWPRGGQ